MRGRIVMVVAALGLVLGVALVTGDERSASAQTAPVEVGLGNYVFIPAELTVPGGATTFNLVNQDRLRHNMVIDFNGTMLESPTLGPNGAGPWNVTLDRPGTYEFWCSVGNHRERGMVGTLTVQSAGPSSQAAPAAAARQAGLGESTITLTMLWIHVPFAVAWIGIAMLDAFLAVAPGLTAAQRASLIRLTLPFVLVAIPVIIVTGVWQTVYNPVTTPRWSWDLLDELKQSTYGWALFYKHVFVVGTLLATLAIKLVLIRRLAVPSLAVPAGQASAQRGGAGTVATATAEPAVDRGLQAGAWINLLCCLAILVCVVLMVYQLH